ncbi:hypothetical protein F5879DRAFT_988132 [Lentinula edodes]|nr:hypothetical protein F5879DRAFT_988132 [Lentinula edodes]
MDNFIERIDSNDPHLLAEAEVDITFRLGRRPLSYYSDTFEHCTRWTFESTSSAVPFTPRLFGIVDKLTGKEFDLGTGPRVYPVLQLVYPNKPGDLFSATFFNQLQVLNDQIHTDGHNEMVTVSSWSTGPLNMSTDGCTIFVFIHRNAILSGVESGSTSDDSFLVEDVARIVKDRFSGNRFLKAGALVEATVSMHRVDVADTRDRYYSLVAEKIDILQQNVSRDLGVSV